MSVSVIVCLYDTTKTITTTNKNRNTNTPDNTNLMIERDDDVSVDEEVYLEMMTVSSS